MYGAPEHKQSLKIIEILVITIHHSCVFQHWTLHSTLMVIFNHFKHHHTSAITTTQISYILPNFNKLFQRLFFSSSILSMSEQCACFTTSGESNPSVCTRTQYNVFFCLPIGKEMSFFPGGMARVISILRVIVKVNVFFFSRKSAARSISITLLTSMKMSLINQSST